MNVFRNYIYVLLVLFISVPLAVKSQDVEKASVFHLKRMLKQAELYGDVYSKAEILEALLKKEASDDNRWELAETYRSINYYSKAKEHYAKLGNTSTYPLATFRHGQMLKQEGAYVEALNLLSSIVPGEAFQGIELENEIKGCNVAIEEGDYSGGEVAIIHLDNSVNSPYSEKAPILDLDSQLIYSGRPADSTLIVDAGASKKSKVYNRFLQAQFLEGSWQGKGLSKLGANDDKGEVSNVLFIKEQNVLIYTLCSYENGKRVCNLLRSKNGEEGEEMNLNMPGYNTTQPTLAYDNLGKPLIYFVSDRPNGKGGYDIWYSEYDSSIMDFGIPKNAGSRLNSMADEMTPFYDELTSTLYFSSSGLPGYGGMDIFNSIGSGQEWGTPNNMGFPFNSSADDLYFFLNDKKDAGFITSNRTGGFSIQHPNCCDDIYEFKYRSPNAAILEIEVIGIENNKDSLGNPLVSLYLTSGDSCVRLKENKIVKEPCDVLINEKQFEDGQTKCYYNIMVDNEYEIKTFQSGTLAKSIKVKMSKSEYSDTLKAVIELHEYTKEAITIENVYYEYNSAQITEESKRELDSSLVKLLIENRHIVVEIGSHTDSVGSFRYNFNLSQSRAENVVEYLVEKGINPEQIKAQGYGELKPVAHNTNLDGSDNVEGRAMNRRTEFKIIGEIEEALKARDIQD